VKDFSGKREMIEIVNTYNIWVTTSAISCLFSLLLLFNFLRRSSVWNKMFHQLSAYLAFLDLISALAWFIGPKYDTTYEICSIQEYLFQGSLLCKGMTTVIICLLSCRVIYTMQIPSVFQVFQALFFGNILGIICLLISISFQSSKIFCTDVDFHDVTRETLIGYIYFNLLPLYLCVLLDLLFYLFIRSKLHQQEQELVLPHPQQQELQQQEKLIDQSLIEQNQKLLRIIQRILFYPLLFGICLLPEATLVLLSLCSVHIPLCLIYIAAAFMGLMGTAVTVNYFYRQVDPSSSSSTTFFGFFNFNWGNLSSEAPVSPAPAFAIGRNLSSILWWGSSARPGSESTIERQTNGTSPRNTDQSGGVWAEDAERGTTGSSFYGTKNPLTVPVFSDRKSLQLIGKQI
jgi:hypothetical protein